MPRRDEVTRRGAIEALERDADTPELIHAHFHLLLHDRLDVDELCSCCGSDTCGVVEDVPDIDVVIDTVEGTRYLRSTFPGPRSVRRTGLAVAAR